MGLFDLHIECGPAASNQSQLSITARTSELGSGTVTTIVVANQSDNPAALKSVEGSVDLAAAFVLEHGWQSWSTVRRSHVRDVRPNRKDAPRWFTNEMLIDRFGAGVAVHGDSFLVTDVGVVGALSAAQQLVTFIAHQDGAVVFSVDLDGIVLGARGKLELEPIWCALGDPGDRYSEYASLAGEYSKARVMSSNRMGWCSWYHYFGDVSPSHLASAVTQGGALGLDVIQIDDGWQREIGDWQATAPSWGPSMDVHATTIATAGFEPGIWTAPFLAIEGGWIHTTRPEWLVRHDDGRPVTALVHGGWGGRIFALDTTHPEVLEHLKETYSLLRSQGFSYHKIDFCFAAAIPGRRFASGTLTRAQALRAGLEAVRAGIGDDAFLVGCGCPLLSAVGIVDAMRVSEDVAPYWDVKEHFDGFPESAVSTRNAIEQSALRAPLHRRWFINDCDCILARPSHTELSGNDRLVARRAVIGLGGFVMLSDDISLYDDTTLGEVAWLREMRTIGDGPLNLDDPFATPLVVRSTHTTLAIDWDDRSASLEVD